MRNNCDDFFFYYGTSIRQENKNKYKINLRKSAVVWEIILRTLIFFFLFFFLSFSFVFFSFLFFSLLSSLFLYASLFYLHAQLKYSQISSIFFDKLEGHRSIRLSVCPSLLSLRQSACPFICLGIHPSFCRGSPLPLKKCTFKYRWPKYCEDHQLNSKRFY